MSDELYKKLRKLNEYITKEQIFALYEQVLSEIESGKKDTGVWTKAYADSRGDLQIQKALYIEMMVERYALAGAAQEELLNEKTTKRKNWEDKKKALEESQNYSNGLLFFLIILAGVILVSFLFSTFY